MPNKRKREKSIDRLRKKIKKYEEKLKRKKQRIMSSSSPERAPTPPQEQEYEFVASDDAQEDDNLVPPVNEPETNKENEGDILDEEILTLLGDAPLEQKFGPDIHKELASRWSGVIKNGLPKEKRSELKKKYLPPGNCKNLDAPKLNLEARAAVTDIAAKRDKAIANKQSQIGCALTSLAMAFGKLYKNKENLTALNHLSDAARLLCDIQQQENVTRRNFILQGLEQTVRDAVKDTEVDEWLFGESFAEKLKASKAIKRSGQEISIHKQRKPQQQHPQQSKPLNYKGPVTNPPRNRSYQSGPQRSYQTYKKPVAQTQFVPQAQRTQTSHKPPKRN